MVKSYTAGNFRADVLENGRPVLVDFSAPGSRPCRILRPALEDVADELGDMLDVGSVNVGVDGEIAAYYNIAAVPTMLLFVGGEPRGRLVGLQSCQEISETLLCTLGVEEIGYTSQQ